MKSAVAWTVTTLAGLGVAAGLALVPGGAAGVVSAHAPGPAQGPAQLAAAHAAEVDGGRVTADPANGDDVTGGDGLRYVVIEEPFSKPGRCDMAGTTLEMTNCFLREVVTVDQQIDVLQRRRFDDALNRKQRVAYLADDAAWLRHRTAEVSKIDTGGTIDAVNQAQMTLTLSKQRLHALS